MATEPAKERHRPSRSPIGGISCGNSGDALRGVLDHHHRDLDEAARIAAVTVEPAANDNAPGATCERDVKPPITKAERWTPSSAETPALRKRCACAGRV